MQAIRRLFRPRAAHEAGRKLYAATAAQARQPAFYLEGGVPDTNEGRFELYSLHVVLALHRLKGQGTEATETAQALFDTYVRSLDLALREIGVGDLSVGKKMRKLGEAFYGRVRSYDAALANLPETEPLVAVIGRTVYAEGGEAHAPALARYAAAAAETLAAQPLAAVLEGRLEWPNFGEAT